MTFRTNPIIECVLGLDAGGKARPGGSPLVPPSGNQQSLHPLIEKVQGLDKRKADLLAAGADLLDLAVAMQEIKNMRASPQEGYPLYDCKPRDAANFGIFRQNWWMIRTCGALKGPEGKPYGPSDYDIRKCNAGEKLNRNLSEDVRVLHASMNKYGVGPPDFGWWWGHRGGETWWRDRPARNDVKVYRDAVLTIYQWLRANPDYQKDSTRVYRKVPGIGPTYDEKSKKDVPHWCTRKPWKGDFPAKP